MATKAELEAELADLKREMKQREQEARTDEVEIAAAKDASDAEGQHKLLDEHGISVDTFDSLRANLLEELTGLQKEKPLVVLIAAVALGIIIGRTFK